MYSTYLKEYENFSRTFVEIPVRAAAEKKPHKLISFLNTR
jgi:hypothetical protein